MRRRKVVGNRNMIGQTVVQLRQSKQISQGELVSKVQLQGIDMNQAKLSRIEGQMISVTDQDIFAIAKALGVSVDTLFQQRNDLVRDA